MLAPSSSTTSPVCCTARARDRRRVTCSPPRARRAYAAPSPRRSPRCRLSTVSIISLLSLFPPHYHIDNRIGLRRPVPDPPRPGRVSGRLLALTGCPSLIDRPPCRCIARSTRPTINLARRPSSGFAASAASVASSGLAPRGAVPTAGAAALASVLKSPPRSSGSRLTTPHRVS